MNGLRVIKAMVAKEFRTTLRERQQLAALIISIVGMSLAMAIPAMRAGEDIARASARAAEWGIFEISATRWICILAGGAIGTFFTLGYVISATVVSFAGERESKTLELVLASPVGDRLLFLGKCVGVMTPSLCLGYLFVCAVASMVQILYGPAVARLPVHWALYMLLFSFPFVLFPSLFLVGVGATVSAKAETSKGAGQILGAVFFVIFFGGGYGLPLLVHVMGWGPSLWKWAKLWMQWSFPAQYASVVGVLAIPVILSLGVGLAMFRRDRLLT